MTRKVSKGGEAVHVGTDYLGNTYYHKPGGGQFDRRIGESTTILQGKRWYFPKGEHHWDEPIPPEWEAWLRYRRLEVPTEEEINLNLAVAHIKKLNARKIKELEDGNKNKDRLEAGNIMLESSQPALVKKEEEVPVNDFLIPSPETGKWPSYKDLEENPGGHRRIYHPKGNKTHTE